MSGPPPYPAPVPSYGSAPDAALKAEGSGAAAQGVPAPYPAYGQPPPYGYAAPPPYNPYQQPGYGGYGPPPSYGAPGYGAPPPGYGAPPPGYGAPPPGYGAAPPPPVIPYPSQPPQQEPAPVAAAPPPPAQEAPKQQYGAPPGEAAGKVKRFVEWLGRTWCGACVWSSGATVGNAVTNAAINAIRR